MFSSGLFGSCCSQDWDNADFCLQLRTPAFLKDTQLLRTPGEAACTPDTSRGTASLTSWPAQANKPEGVRTHPGLVQTWRAGDGSGQCVACREAPHCSLGSKQDSLLLAEMWDALLLAQCRDPSPAPASPAAPPGWRG